MNCSTWGSPVLHYLLKFVQNHDHWTGDTIQPSHSLFCPSPPTLNLSQHQNIFQWITFSHQVAKYWSFSFITIPFNEYSGLISFSKRRKIYTIWRETRVYWFGLLAVQGTPKIFSSTTIQNHYLFHTLPSLQPNSHMHIWFLEKPYLWPYRHCLQSDIFAIKYAV